MLLTLNLLKYSLVLGVQVCHNHRLLKKTYSEYSNTMDLEQKFFGRNVNRVYRSRFILSVFFKCFLRFFSSYKSGEPALNDAVFFRADFERIFMPIGV